MAGTRWIDAQPALDELCAHLAGQEWVAVDTEFLADRSYFPRLCLVQVATPDIVACIDPLQSGVELAPLWSVLRDESVTKVFHAGENDIAVLLPAVGATVAPAFDTQVAAAFLGHGASIGYGGLVERVLGVALDKSHARADWSRRPLPRPALQYAADDVRHLRELFVLLRDELTRRGRTHWAQEEFECLVDPARYREDPGSVWRRVRGHHHLDDVGLAILRELARWRESTARATNRPRRWVLQDEVLVEIARARPRDDVALASVRGFDARRRAADCSAILAMVGCGLGVPAADRPQVEGRPRDEREAAALDALQSIVCIVAAEHGLPEPLLAGSADLLKLLRGAADVPVLTGWRREVVGATLAAFLGGRASLRVEGGQLRIEFPPPTLPS